MELAIEYPLQYVGDEFFGEMFCFLAVVDISQNQIEHAWIQVVISDGMKHLLVDSIVVDAV